jgi:hypothetical protein
MRDDLEVEAFSTLSSSDLKRLPAGGEEEGKARGYSGEAAAS